MRRLSLFTALFALVSHAHAAGKCDHLVATGSPDAPPYLWRDPQHPDRLIGASADLLARIGQDLGVTIDVLYAGNRDEAREQVKVGRMDLLADAPLAFDELESVDYIYPAWVVNDYLVWTRIDSVHEVASVADLSTQTGAISRKARLTPAFAELAKTHLKLQSSEDLAHAFKQLAKGDVDYVIAGRNSGLVQVQALGLSSELIAHEQPLDRPGLYLALSHDSACNDPWLRGQLAKKMTELPASGLAETVLQQNMERWTLQQHSAPQH